MWGSVFPWYYMGGSCLNQNLDQAPRKSQKAGSARIKHRAVGGCSATIRTDHRATRQRLHMPGVPSQPCGLDCDASHYASHYASHCGGSSSRLHDRGPPGGSHRRGQAAGVWGEAVAAAALALLGSVGALDLLDVGALGGGHHSFHSGPLVGMLVVGLQARLGGPHMSLRERPSPRR